MKRFGLSACLCIAAWAASLAIPAKIAVRSFTQSDGTVIHVTLQGDEWNHNHVSDDGRLLLRDAAGDFRYRISTGASTMLAHDAADRSTDEAAYVEQATAGITAATVYNAQRRTGNRINKVSTLQTQVPTTGSPRIPVVLVNYNDKHFTSNDPVATWTTQLCSPTQPSLFKYFSDQSFGQFTPQFDLIGPVTLSQNRVAYGGNDSYGYDVGVGQMVAEACLGADDSVDWSRYDNDGDGVCDVVIVLYAGDGEASSRASDSDNSVWPCQWDLASSDYQQNITIDGVTISKFACFNELYGDLSKIDGVGTMAHEFSHCIGLPDFYDTYYTGKFGMASWSLMDYGCYNNDGYTPCAYTAYERDYMGWKILCEPVAGTNYTITAAADGGEAFKITSPNVDEYYIVENVQQTGWNEYAYASGLQVTHVHYRESYWINNTVNCYNTQCMSPVPADNWLRMDRYYGVNYLNLEDQAGDLYPYNGNDELTSVSTPAMTLQSQKANLDKPVKKIKRNADGTVSFKYIPDPPPAPVALPATNVTRDSFTANWEPVDDAISYAVRIYQKPEYSLLVAEDMHKFIASGFTSVGNSLDSRMDNPGWTGYLIFSEPGGIRFNSAYVVGYLVSPMLDFSDSKGFATIKVSAKCYTATSNCDMNVIVNGQTYTITVKNTLVDDYILVVPCDTTTQQIEFRGVEVAKKFIITGIEIYSGNAYNDIAKAPIANGPAKVSYDLDGDYYIASDITDTNFSFGDLDGSCDINYAVKAIYPDEESGWSNIITAEITKAAPPRATGDVNGDGGVDMLDLNAVISVIMESNGYEQFLPYADVNQDGAVDIRDVNFVVQIILN